MNFELKSQLDAILSGDVRTLARTLSQVENQPGAKTAKLMRELYPHAGGAFIIGVTGAPGTGKSTLVDGLAGLFRQRGDKVAIVAVDPSSPFSGGAILGDRVRMRRLTKDDGIFIRSMATRGKLGGLSSAVREGLLVLDAAGFDILVVETVGVGQDEVDIAKSAHATVVVLVPGMGDEIQAVKAGIMEIGDVFAVNKADREGADRTEAELEALLSSGEREDGWRPPVVPTVATRSQGLEELIKALDEYRKHLGSRKGRRRQAFKLCRQQLLEMLRDRMVERVVKRLPEGELDRMAEKLMTGECDPYTILDRLLAESGLEGDEP